MIGVSVTGHNIFFFKIDLQGKPDCLGHSQGNGLSECVCLGFIDVQLKSLKPGTVLECLIGFKKFCNYIELFIGMLYN